MAENAEDRIKPIKEMRIPVKAKLAYGSIIENGATPSIDTQIIIFLPKRSPKNPPINVPAATEIK